MLHTVAVAVIWCIGLGSVAGVVLTTWDVMRGQAVADDAAREMQACERYGKDAGKRAMNVVNGDA